MASGTTRFLGNANQILRRGSMSKDATCILSMVTSEGYGCLHFSSTVRLPFSFVLYLPTEEFQWASSLPHKTHWWSLLCGEHALGSRTAFPALTTDLLPSLKCTWYLYHHLSLVFIITYLLLLLSSLENILAGFRKHCTNIDPCKNRFCQHGTYPVCKHAKLCC